MRAQNLPLLIGAGLVAGAVGFYAGLIVLLALTGLDAPGWAPVAQLAGATSLGAVAVTVVSKKPARTVLASLVAAGLVGAGAGFIIMQADGSLEMAMGVAGVLVVLVAAGFATTQRRAPHTG